MSHQVNGGLMSSSCSSSQQVRKFRVVLATRQAMACLINACNAVPDSALRFRPTATSTQNPTRGGDLGTNDDVGGDDEATQLTAPLPSLFMTSGPPAKKPCPSTNSETASVAVENESSASAGSEHVHIGVWVSRHLAAEVCSHPRL